MRITLEKVLILQSVDLLSSVPEDALVEIASILEEVDVEPDSDIISQGEMGTAMYIIIDGRVRVHADGRDIAELGPREVFGELAALDPEPRAASVTAVEPTQLFKLSSVPLFELMADHMGVTRGILKVLCRRVRATS
jgi:CRP-like cAMP-binding protein